MRKKIDEEEIQEKYRSVRSTYKILGKNLVESISILLADKNMKILSLTYRVKSTDSFMEKKDRKKYNDPLNETEDICGIRILCYYLKDIPQIVSELENKFVIHESRKKENSLEFDQFGYRSHHIIASIKKAWTKVPNYKGMEGLKCEIQIRTVLMHAWAEIEHNLAYKNIAQVPHEFRRKLHRISAKLEEADEQFEELKAENSKYQKGILDKVSKNKGKFTDTIELNLDSLQVFLDTNFSSRGRELEETSRLLQEMLEYNISLGDLQKAYETIGPKFSELESEYWEHRRLNKWVQVGAARIILDLTNKKYRSRHRGSDRVEEREQLSKKYNT